MEMRYMSSFCDCFSRSRALSGHHFPLGPGSPATSACLRLNDFRGDKIEISGD